MMARLSQKWLKACPRLECGLNGSTRVTFLEKLSFVVTLCGTCWVEKCPGGIALANQTHAMCCRCSLTIVLQHHVDVDAQQSLDLYRSLTITITALAVLLPQLLELLR